MEFRPILHIVGILVTMLGISMALPMMVDLYSGNSEWSAFFLSILITCFFGGLLLLTTSGDFGKISPKQGFVMVSFTWIALCLFAALPFWLTGQGLSLTDSLFESISGLTTTGSTVLTGLDEMPEGLLLWRALLQWLGGIGVILMAMSVMPFLKIGGMQLFQTELSESEKALPRVAQLASSIGLIYVALTFICMICYHITGLGEFESLLFAMTTIATGGYAPHDASFGYFTTAAPLIVGIVFMIAGGLPFVLYLKALKGNFKPLFTDSQARWFLSISIIATLSLVLFLVSQEGHAPASALLHSAFNCISIITGTGFTSTDYDAWGGFPVILFFFLMVVGACAGSTSCGIKIFRFQVLYAITGVQLRKMIYPHGMFIPRYNGKPIADTVSASVMGFFFLFALSFTLLTIALSFTGLDFITAISAAATAIANVGPGLGDVIGPVGNFKSLPDSAKYIMCLGMILGRLEIFPLLILLSPHLWRP